MPTYLIAHDLGTSGDKATLFTTDGKLIKSVNFSYHTRYFNGNWAEQDPLDWWRAVCESNRQLLSDVNCNQIAGVAFSGQMMGCVCIDKHGELLRNAIIWADLRSTSQEQQLKEKIPEDSFYRITGHRISSAYSLEKLMWIRENQPELFRRIYKVLLPKDYIIYRLTGKLFTDYSDASGTNAFDLNRLRWSEEILKCAGIDSGLFPDIVPSTYIAGGVHAQVAKESALPEGTPVVLGGGDGVCAAVGAGSCSENVAYAYLGSSSWLSYTSKKPLYDESMRTFNWVHIIPGYYAPTGTMQAAGNSLSFIKDIICKDLTSIALQKQCNVYDLIGKEIESSPLGGKGLIYLPYLMGERSPRWDADARGAFIGLKMEHQRADILRATTEGILMNLDIILQIFRQHADIKSMNLIGGMAKTTVVREMLADIFGCSVNSQRYLEEATSIGAAVTAGVATGALENFDRISDFIGNAETGQPNSERSEQYRPLKEVFDASYYALKPIYRQLAKL